MIARTLLAIGVLLSAVGPSVAQTPDPYLQLVRMYRTDPAPAIVSMARMTASAISAGLKRCVPVAEFADPACGPADVLAGAMLHLDAAEQVLAPNSQAALVHIRAGQTLLQTPPYLLRGARLISPTPDSDAKVMFARRWHASAARLFLVHGHAVAATAILTEGRTRYKEAPEFFVVLGLITEWRAGVAGIGWLSSDLRGAVVSGEMFDDPLGFAGAGSSSRGSVLQRLETASADYRRALAAAPAHAGARLRLAWVHLLAGDARVWEDVPTAFLETADAEARLLARLIRGTTAERERRSNVALAEYREAWRAAPGSQTACLAVTSAQALNGDFAGSDATAAECLTLGNDPEQVDPWTLFRMGLMDATTTRWLHDEARQP